jgi:probable rRNA maturation factor
MGTGKKNQKTTVLITSGYKNLKVSAAGFRKLIKAICGRFKISKATVSLTIVGDAQIRKINRQFLGHSGTTDCISFDLSDNRTGKSTNVFDIIVNGQMAVRQARRRGHSSEAELALYVTHGLLHNLGFDDLRPRDAQKMHKIEDEILQQFGYGPVYNNRAKTK